MGNDKRSNEEIIARYKPELARLLPYADWLRAHRNDSVASSFSGEGIGQFSMTFPVYDGTLMNFVRTAQSTDLMDRNYMYTYSRNRLRTIQDERRFIQNAELQDMNELCGILSKYILKGMTKASMWPMGVQEGIFLDIILKMQELIAFWDKQV